LHLLIFSSVLNQLSDGTISIGSDDIPYGLYNPATEYDENKPEAGLFRSPALIHVSRFVALIYLTLGTGLEIHPCFASICAFNKASRFSDGSLCL
jgi:hypothetical protein